jgi:hypothetical protein
MIDREDLLDNADVRKLARQLKKIPGVIMVRWVPSWRPTLLDADPNAVMFTLITANPHPNKEYVRADDGAPFMGPDTEGYCFWTKGVGQRMYEIEENCQLIYNSFSEAIENYLK